MTPDDIAQIERELGIAVPGDYHTLVSNRPMVVKEYEEL